MADTQADVKEFVISRNYDAPRDTVWKAWTEADRLTQWWSPKGFTTRLAKFDLKPGGMCHYAMTGEGGGPEMWGKAVYREVVPQSKIVSVISFSDENAGYTRHPMSPTWPREMLTTFEFVSEGANKTNVVIHWIPINAGDDEIKTFDEGREGMKMGWTGTLDQLGDYLAGAKS
jgi:uncharacterized protein YndB with AHSA1/START domain